LAIYFGIGEGNIEQGAVNMLIKNKLNSYFINQWENAMKKNNENILNLLDTNPQAKLLDLGCDNGEWTSKIANKVMTKNIYGIEICLDAAKESMKKGIDVKLADLNEPFPFSDNFFDIIHANQVIEHIINVDSFIQEIYRILKPSGYVVISTENLSGIDNLLAFIFRSTSIFSTYIRNISYWK